MDYLDYALRRRHHVLAILWALLFAKCFILEYCVALYSVPINTALYVWSLSLFMATAATLVYFNLVKEQQGGFRVESRSGMVWIYCLVALLLISVASLAFRWIEPIRLPAIAAGIFACAYANQYFLLREAPALCCALGWCLAIVVLIGVAGPLPLLIFGIWLIGFTAFPSLLVYLRLSKDQTSA